ncbi:hypothetical protein [Cohnella silvisoli]|uniref:AsmA-like C-terminal domain-containing protein n=1 Tax=Cohnella silvisoli TaxID=2873699 RepID=A0ABV1KYT7_9BACL|nr:hypothetical protein [Cohnella silvisoli]MCD9024360.1 hypothetical protein [Cohnella silvisoli]
MSTPFLCDLLFGIAHTGRVNGALRSNDVSYESNRKHDATLRVDGSMSAIGSRLPPFLRQALRGPGNFTATGVLSFAAIPYLSGFLRPLDGNND